MNVPTVEKAKVAAHAATIVLVLLFLLLTALSAAEAVEKLRLISCEVRWRMNIVARVFIIYPGFHSNMAGAHVDLDTSISLFSMSKTISQALRKVYCSVAVGLCWSGLQYCREPRHFPSHFHFRIYTVITLSTLP